MAKKLIVTLEQDSPHANIDDLHREAGSCGFIVSEVEEVDCEHTIKRGDIVNDGDTINIVFRCYDCGEKFEFDVPQKLITEGKLGHYLELSWWEDYIDSLESEELDEEDHRAKLAEQFEEDDDEDFFPANPIGDQ